MYYEVHTQFQIPSKLQQKQKKAKKNKFLINNQTNKESFH